jgi:hypothetical protein
MGRDTIALDVGRDGTRKSRHGMGRDSQRKIRRDGKGRDDQKGRPAELCCLGPGLEKTILEFMRT